jgi:hypothetical protein
MRPNFDRLAALNDALARREQPNHARNLQIVEALYREARALGVWRATDPLAGLEVDRRVARAFNARVGDV